MSLPDQAAPSADIPAADELSFDAPVGTETASVAQASCNACSESLGHEYWVSDGKTLCEICAAKAKTEAEARPGFRGFLKACAFGAGAAMAGWLIYYLVSLTGYEFGLIAIIVGLMVGVAVRAGSGGKGGWLYQLVAIAFTYLAIAGSYTPYVVEGMLKGEREEQAKQAQLDSADTAGGEQGKMPDLVVQDSKTAARTTTRAPIEATWLTYVIGFMISLAMPFLSGLENFMGIIILGIGLYEAWKINKRVLVTVEGPFALAAGAALPA